MAMLSIPSYKSDDPNYRYKMPRLIAKVEGRGNGIRTNIVNMGDIARALKRPPDYPTKFCGHELGAQSKFDPAEGKAIVNGMHEQRDLQLLIDKFIDKFVLCENCKLPEIDLTLKKNRVGYSCNACGNQGQVDNRHKLATFILKNPPDGGDSTLGAKKKKSREERQRNRALKASGKGRENADGIPDGDDVEEDNVEEEDEAERKARKAAKKAAKKEKEKYASKTSSGKTKEKSSSQHPGGDESDDAVKENGATVISRGQPSSTTGSLPDDENENNSINGSANPSDGKKKSTKKTKKQPTHTSTADQDELHYQSPEVRDVVQRLLVFCYPEHEEHFQGPNQDDEEQHYHTVDPPTKPLTLTAQATPSNFFNQLRLLQVSQDFDHRVKLYVALEVLFHKFAGGLTVQGLAKKIAYIQNVAHGMVPSDVLGAFEDFVYCESPFLDGSQFKQYPYVLQKLYDADIVDEDGILRYYTSKRVAKTVDNRSAYESAVKAAKPFLDWLQQSDGESAEEEDSSSAAPQVTAPSQATQQAVQRAQERDAVHTTATGTTGSSDRVPSVGNPHVSDSAVKKTDGVSSKPVVSSQAEENADEDEDLDIDEI